MDASTATSASSSTPLLEFLIIAYDGTDPDAPTRRLAVRQQHLDRARQGKIDGSVVYGGAILGDDGAMIGSSMVVRFPTRAAFDAWLAADPYVVGNVWKAVEVRPFRLAPLPQSHPVAQRQSSNL